MKRAGQAREVALALGFLALWILIPFREIAMLDAVNIQNDVYASDLLHDRLPSRAFVGESLRQGELPLWMPGIYTGFPALASIEAGALYPSNWILFGFLDPWWAIAWAQLLPLFLAGAGTFLLARELGTSREASLLAAGAFALSGFLVCHLRQLNMVDAAAWIPVLFLLVDRALAGRHGILPWFAVVWALQLLAGHPQISFFTALALAAWCVARWSVRTGGEGASLVRRTVGWARSPAFWKLAIGALLGTLIAGAQLLPTTELAALGHRSGGLSFEEASRYAADPASLTSFVVPYLYGDPGRGTYALSGLFWEQYGYVGLIPFVLAVLAVATRWRRPPVLLLALMGITASILFVGPATPVFHWALAVVPGMDFFRFPTRFLVFVELAVALLAAFGFDVLLSHLSPSRARRAFTIVLLTVTAIDLWMHQMRQVPQIEISRWTSPVDTAVFLSGRRRATAEAWRVYTPESPGFHQVAFREARGWSGDLTPYVRHRELLQPSANLLHDLDTPDGYVNLVPDHYERLWGSEKAPGLVVPAGELAENGWRLAPHVVRLLRSFNVRYVISPLRIINQELREVFVSPAGVAIFELDGFLPRAFVVGAVRRVTDDAEGIDLLRSGDLDPAHEAIVHQGIELPSGATSSRNVRLGERTNTSLTVHARLEEPGLLVVSEGWYPGWTVTVDGKPETLVRANLMMRGVVLDAGDHEVVFRFASPTIRWGLGASIVGFVGLALVLWKRA